MSSESQLGTMHPLVAAPGHEAAGASQHGAGEPRPLHGDAHAHEPHIVLIEERFFEVIERLLTGLVALFLVGLSVLSLINVVLTVWTPIMVDHDYSRAIEAGFEGAFLTVILLEILSTVVSRHSITAKIQAFLVIGVTSAIRHGLEIAAAGSGSGTVQRNICLPLPQHAATALCRVVEVAVPKPEPLQLVIELAINAFCAVLLVGALWLIRTSRGHTAHG